MAQRMDPSDAGGASRPAAHSAYDPGHHWVSPLNFDPAVQSAYAFPNPLTIFDSTLRKILYVNGLRPRIDDLLFIAEALEEAGVREELVNVHWWGEPTPEKLEYGLCRAVLARKFAFRTTVCWDLPSPTHDVDAYPVPFRQAVDVLREAGMDNFSVALRDPKTPGAREDQLERLGQVISYAQSLGVTCAVSINDSGRSEFEYVMRAANEGIRLGAIRVDLSESYSSLSPEAIKLFVTRFRAGLVEPVPGLMHVHDDFGLGTASVIAAATAGAHPDVAVNGLSYRAGFAALEEVVVSLEILYGVATGIRMDRLQRLSDIVAERTGFPNHPLKPVTGTHAFLRDFPSWVLQYLRVGADGFPPAASCFPPALVGARMRAVWGTHHSTPVIRAKLRQMGLTATEEQIGEIRRRVEAGVDAREGYPRWLTEDEVEGICREVAVGR